MKLCVRLFIMFATWGVMHAQVGIGNTNPKTTLDIDGGLSLREGPTLALNNGFNNDVPLGTEAYSFYRITGPTGPFGISGIIPESGSDGQILTLQNTTDHQMFLYHDFFISSADNRIYCPDEETLSLVGKYATVTLQYNATYSRWIVLNYQHQRMGDNIKAVKGTTDVSINTTTYTDMPDMTITFVPKHETVFVSFSASGSMDLTGSLPVGSYGLFRLVNVTASNSVEAGTTSLATDYDYDDTVGEVVGSAWNAQFVMLPVQVTPGIFNTLKIQWARDGISPTALENFVVANVNFSHRNFTIMD
ncbi:hypothetical protein [Aureisphaera sp.]